MSNAIETLHAQQLGKMAQTEVRLRMFLQVKDERIRLLQAELKQLKAQMRKLIKSGGKEWIRNRE